MSQAIAQEVWVYRLRTHEDELVAIDPIRQRYTLSSKILISLINQRRSGRVRNASSDAALNQLKC